MVNKKDLREGIVKMREVAELLSGWADDMEHSLEKKGRKSAADVAVMVTETPAAHPVVPEEKPAAKAEVKYEDLRSLLAEKSAAGYRTQVIALIRSYGAEKLSEVDKSYYADLYEAVSGFVSDTVPESDSDGDDCAG